VYRPVTSTRLNGPQAARSGAPHGGVDHALEGEAHVLGRDLAEPPGEGQSLLQLEGDVGGVEGLDPARRLELPTPVRTVGAVAGEPAVKQAVNG